MSDHERIGEFLVRVAALTPEQVEAILEEQQAGDPQLFGLIAIRRGMVSEEMFQRYLREHVSLRDDVPSSILTQAVDDAFTIEVIGPLSSDAADQFQAALDEAEGSGCATVDLDFELLQNINSRCLGQLLVLQSKLANAGREIFIRRANQHVRLALLQLGIDELIPFRDADSDSSA